MTLVPLSWVALLALALSPQTEGGEESFVQAIQRSDTAEVVRLLGSGIDPNATDEDGTPALMLAALFADAECVSLLLEHGADPNRKSAAGTTPLMWAIPDLEKVRLLLDYGADVNANSIIFERTPLLIAASYPQSVEVLRLLIASGADIHTEDGTGANALTLASRSADVEVVRFLRESGIDPNNPPAAVRYQRHHSPTVEYLISEGLKIDENALVGAVTWQEPEQIDRWIEMGANVNARTDPVYGRTPLSMAAASELSSPETLELLLQGGADPNAETTEGERPLDWAFYRSDPERIEVLERHGATRGNGPRQATYPRPPARRGEPRTSLSRSTDLLLNAAPPIYENRGCVSCHHNALPGLLAPTLRRKGIAVNEGLAGQNLDDILAVYTRGIELAMQGRPAVGGVALTTGYVMMALAAEAYPLDKLTAAAIHWVAATQMPDGSWLGNGTNRPPIEYSPISHTAMAVRALTLYPVPGWRDQIERQLQQARSWLLASEANSAEERGMRLMALVWTGAPQSGVDQAIEEILLEQGADGGWSQLPQLDADAYATGLSLFALREAGVSIDDDIYRRGVEFLLTDQYPDGSWFVRSRSFPTQPYFESGFPFGRHQWVSAAGTAWAALAIASTLPDIDAGQ